VLALAACHGGGGAVDAGDAGAQVSNLCAITSGSRLRANYWLTNDGGMYFAGTWHDNVLGHDCAFGTIPGDTNVYCLPTSDGIWAAEYSDSLCSVPVVDVDPSCSVTSPIFSFTNMASSGNTAVDFYPITGAYTGMRWQENGCRATTDSPPAGFEFHGVGSPLDKSMFAVATPYTATGPTRLHATGYMAPDGAIQACSTTTFFDSQRNETCHSSLDEYGRARCLPSGYTFSDAGLYSDTACHVIAGLLSSAPALPYEAVSVAMTCGTGTKIFKLSGPLATEYTSASGQCAAISPNMPNYYAAGEEITPDHFAGLSDVPIAIPGQRLQENVTGAADGFGMSTGTFTDSQLGATCRFATASDGTTRCLPGDPTNQPRIGTLYSDSICSTPISIITVCSGVAPRFAQVVGAPSAQPTCTYQGVTRAYAVGAAVTDTLYEVSGTQCVQSSFTGPGTYALGGELPPAMFVQAQLTAN
jgi:hypothetical protein